MRPMCAVGIALADGESVTAPNLDAGAFVLAGVLWEQWAGLEFDVLLGMDWLESFDLAMSGGTFTIAKPSEADFWAGRSASGGGAQ